MRHSQRARDRGDVGNANTGRARPASRRGLIAVASAAALLAPLLVGPPGTAEEELHTCNGELKRDERSDRRLVGSAGLAVADYKGDGFPDVATGLETDEGIFGPQFVATLLNNGELAVDGDRFADPDEYGIEGWARLLAAADFVGNGTQDVAVYHVDPAGMELLRNVGGGVFAHHDSVDLSEVLGPHDKTGQTLTKENQALAADFTGDGRPDWMAPKSRGLVLVENQGAGILGEGVGYDYEPEDALFGLVEANITASEVPDLVTYDPDPGKVHIHQVNPKEDSAPDIAFEAKTIDIENPASVQAGSFTASDSADNDDGPLSGVQGTARAHPYGTTNAVANGSQEVATETAADDGDEPRDDLAIMDTRGTVWIVENHDGALQTPRKVHEPAVELEYFDDPKWQSLTAGDVNGDGHDDLLSAGLLGDNFEDAATLLLGDGKGGFAVGGNTPCQLPVPDDAGWTTYGLDHQDLADVNGDGTRELVTTMDRLGFWNTGTAVAWVSLLQEE